MNRTRYLPPGSMRRQRRRGRIEGALGTLIVLACIGAAVIAATPVEIYRAARSTNEPAGGTPLNFARLPLPPCTDTSAKDCMAVADPVVRPIPEPGTGALVAIAAAGMALQRSQK